MKKFKIFLLVIGFCCIAGIGIFFYISPILKPFPSPTGAYSIGTQLLSFVDQQRTDPYSSANEKRTIMARIWYPSSVQVGEQYPYLGSKMPLLQKIFAEKNNIPLWLSKILWRNIKTHGYSNAPISYIQSSYPIILFSHGLLGLPTDFCVSIIENLASLGYMVVAIDHPYFNLITQYPNGRIVSSDNLSTQFQKMGPQEQKEFLSKAIDTYKVDLHFVLDQLQDLNQNEKSIFYNRLDLTRIGVMGYSAGGTAAIEFCRNDKRCKAAANLDGWYDHIIGHEPLQQPLLLMFGSKSLEISEPTSEYLKRKELTREQYFEREHAIAQHRKELCSVPHCSFVVISHATHSDFGDSLLLKWPFREWNVADSYNTLKQINNHLVQFFDTYFK